MQPQKGTGKSAAEVTGARADRAPQHTGRDPIDPDLPAGRAEADSAQRSAVPQWLKQTTREINWLLALFVVLCIGYGLIVLHAALDLPHLEPRWEALTSFLMGRGALALALRYLLTLVHLTYSRAVALRAAAVFGDSVTLASTIAAHGFFPRNLVLHSSQTTEEIARHESRSSPESAKDHAAQAKDSCLTRRKVG